MSKALWLIGLASGGVLAVVLWRRHRATQWREQPNYVQAIQAWAPSEPEALRLPPIRVRHAEVVPEWRMRRAWQRGR